MFLFALTPVGAQQVFTATGSAQTSAQLGFNAAANPSADMYLIQPVGADVSLTLDGTTAPVVGSCFKLTDGLFTALTRGEMVKAKWIGGGSVIVQGCLKPPFPQIL